MDLQKLQRVGVCSMVLCTLLTEVGPDKSRYGEIGIRAPRTRGCRKRRPGSSPGSDEE